MSANQLLRKLISTDYKTDNFTFNYYELPLTQPYRWAKGEHFVRCGIFVRYQVGDVVGYGEIAPPPHLKVDAEGSFLAAKNLLEKFNGKFENFPNQVSIDEINPRIRCGLVSAWFDAQAKIANISFANCLGKYLEIARTAATSIPINALITDKTPEAAREKALEQSKKGITTFKVKLTADHELDFQRVKAVREALPTAYIRLDPNGAWTVDNVLERMNQFAQFVIQYAEDPLPGEGGLQSYRKIKGKTPFKIAIDELAFFDQIEVIAKEKLADVVILKPQRLGGADNAIKAHEIASRYGIQSTITSSLESAIGDMVTMQTASLFQQPINHCGMGTGRFIKENVAELPEIIDGKITLPTGAGLGLEILNF
jgi:O-succinylbenzoate synthase